MTRPRTAERRSAMAFASIDILMLPGPERSLDQASDSPDNCDGGRVRSRNVAPRTTTDRAYSASEMCSRAVWSRDESPGPKATAGQAQAGATRLGAAVPV